MHSLRNVLFRFLAMLGAHELAVLLGLAGIVSGVWLFALIAGEVMDGDTRSMDQRLLLALRRPDHLSPIGPPAVQDAARDITALGSPSVLTLVTLITCGFLLLDGRRHMALFVCASIASGLGLSTILKDSFQRPRPDLVPRAAYVSTTSFPSGHSMLSAVTYLTLGALLGAIPDAEAPQGVFPHQQRENRGDQRGVSRVYLGVHWPTDVLAGWTAGVSWAIICSVTARWLQRQRLIEGEAKLISQGQT